MSLSLREASQDRRGGRVTASGSHAGTVRARADFEIGAVGPKNKKTAGLRPKRAGALTAVQTQAFVIIGTAATYSEELAAFFEDGEHEQALQQLKATCCKVLEIMKASVFLSAKPRNYKLGSSWYAISSCQDNSTVAT
ncbi:TPA: hypothetical protein ACH3X2_012234 [Trebouxia sp. C0005]